MMNESETDVKKVKTFEDLLQVIKPEGRWQYQILLLFLMQELLSNATNRNYIYMVGIPDYYCTVPELENANWTRTEIEEVTGTNSTNECKIVDRNYTALALGWNETTLTNSSEVDCEHWKFTPNEYYGYTAVSEWSLICSNTPYRPTIQGVYMFGVLFGSLTGGIFADTYGRRTVVLMMMSLFAIGGVCCSIFHDYSTFLVFRFMTGFGGVGAYVVMYSLVLECLVADIRAKWTCYITLACAVLDLVFTGAAYGIRHFRYFNLVYAIPSIATPILCYWYLPESPRWLITHNRLHEANQIVNKAARKNKVHFEDSRAVRKMVLDVYENIEKEEYAELTTGSLTLRKSAQNWLRKFKDASNNKAFRTRVFCVGFTWFAVSLASYGCGYLLVKLEFGPFIPDLLKTAKAIPAYLLMKPAVDYFGRKPVMYVSFFTFSALIISSALSPANLIWLPFLFVQMGGFFLDILFNDVYLVTAELFPTEMRSMAVCFGSVCARIGSIAAPYIVDLLISPYRSVPGLIFGGVSALAGFATLFLPETKQKCLPNTVFEIKEEKAAGISAAEC